MKKILSLCLAFLLFCIAGAAQDGIRQYRMRQGLSQGELTRPEMMQLRKDRIRYRIAEKNARRDGIVTLRERRRLHKIREKNRREAFYFRHNRRQRVI